MQSQRGRIALLDGWDDSDEEDEPIGLKPRNAAWTEPATTSQVAFQGPGLDAASEREIGKKMSRAEELLERALKIQKKELTAGMVPTLGGIYLEESDEPPALPLEELPKLEKPEKPEKPRPRSVMPPVSESEISSLFGPGAARAVAGARGSQRAFRGSMRAGLLAVPGRDGKVRVMRLVPSQLRIGKPGQGAATAQQVAGLPALPAPAAERLDEAGGAAQALALSSQHLVTALRQEDFAIPVVDDRDGRGVPALTLRRASGLRLCKKQLLRRYVELCKQHGQSYAAEAFELLEAAAAEDEEAQDPHSEELRQSPFPMDAAGARRLRTWLSRVTTRNAQAHIHRMASDKFRPDSVELHLEAAFHYLTANSMTGALRELNECGNDGRGIYFDRLASILASCGGMASTSQARVCLANQFRMWLGQHGARELMGPQIWRLYGLLSGDVEEVVTDMMDWRALLGACLWYRIETDEEEAGIRVPAEKRPRGQLRAALTGFDSLGYARRFCAPAYVAERGPKSTNCGEVQDLQLSFVRGLLGKGDVTDPALYDVSTHSERPLDLALSWHFSALLRAMAIGGVTAKPAFDLLTQQYCFVLEAEGHREDAAYLARFIGDNRARSLVLAGLAARHARKGASAAWRGLGEDLPASAQAWLYRAAASEREAAWDWCRAAAFWLKAEDPERAARVTLAFLIPQVLLRSAVPVTNSGFVGAVRLPAPPARSAGRWAADLLHEALQLRSAGHTMALAREVLTSLEQWSADAGVGSDDVIKLVRRCEAIRDAVLGLPR